MIEEENKNFRENTNEILQKQILNPRNIITEEISDIYSYIDLKINSTFQNNYSQSVNELNLRLDQIENNYQQQAQTKNNEINEIKNQLSELKSQINKENTSLNQFLEEKVARNTEQIMKITKIVKSQSKLYETNYFDDLKCELKQLKERLNSDLYSTPANESNSDKSNEFSSDFLHEENKKIKSNLKSIKSEIKKIITNALNQDDEVFEKNTLDDLQIELSETPQKTQINNLTEKTKSCSDLINKKKQNYSRSKNKNTIDYSDSIKENNFCMNSNENDILFNRINEIDKKLRQLQYEIKKLVESNKSELKKNEFVKIINDVKYKEIETAYIVNEIQIKAIEANNNSIEAQFKTNDAVLRAAEAESKATSANEKADLIVSDNNKMNVDIKCLKYEVKKLRSRVLELEKSENQNDICKRIDNLESKVKHMNSNLKKFREEKIQNSYDKTENEEMNIYETNVIQIKNENKLLKNELKSVKSEVKRIKDNLHSAEVISIPGDFIKKLNDTQNQSSYACEKAAKTNQEISIFQNETITKIDKIKTDIHSLKNEIRKMKESQNSKSADKPQKKDEKKKKNNFD